MSEVTVIPRDTDNSSGFVALVLVILVALVLLGFFAFSQGWLSMGTSNPNSIELSVPTQDSSATDSL